MGILLLMTMRVFGQDFATTDEGKRVKLNHDGTWEYVGKDSATPETEYVYMGGKPLVAGKTEIIHEEKYGMTTSVTIAKNEEKTIIIFWQTTSDQNMNFFNRLWTGKVLLYLENGETISLIDRNMKGQNII